METSPPEPKPRRRATPLFKYTLTLLLGVAIAAFSMWFYLDESLGWELEGERVYKKQPKTRTEAERGINDGVAFNQDVRRLNADAEFRKLVGNASQSKATLIYTDFNNDRVEDVLVGIYGEGAAGYLNQAVYTVIGGKLKLMWRNPDTLARAKGYVADGQSIVMTGARDFDANNASADTIYTYRWDGSTFNKVE
jgi:hypothetical protein